MASSDIVVIGAGVIGASIAYRLSEAGYSVTVLDKDAPGSGASGACDQAIFLQSKQAGLPMRLALESRRMFGFLEDELDSPLEFSADGGMVAIENEQQLQFMTSFSEQQRRSGFHIELLDYRTTHEAQPHLAEEVLGVTYSPLDAEVNPLLLNAGFLKAAGRHGARVVRRAEVRSVIESGERVTGVNTDQGAFHADLVINAAGPHAGLVSELAGVSTPITPRRGTILITEPVPRQINGVLLSAQYVAAKHFRTEPGDSIPFGVGLSLGQSASGNLLVGGSREFVGFSRDVSAAVIRTIARHAVGIVPALKNYRVIRTMKGFRPYTGDGLPIIGVSKPGWITAAGHEGDGIALAPITGVLVRDLVTGSNATEDYLPHLASTRSSLDGVRASAGV
ncbi:NAD(P)/FAD-dependent oxidoreductase [Leucobacter sp. GX24907]